MMGIIKAIFASKSFPLKCKACGKKEFRKHDISKALVYFGGTIGLFSLLFLYMAKGGQVAFLSLVVYLSLLIVIYIAELFLFDLTEYTDREESRVIDKSKKNIWIIVIVLFLGIIFYAFDI
jgi:predicted membrane protein